MIAEKINSPFLLLPIGESKAGERDREFYLETGVGLAAGGFPDKVILGVFPEVVGPYGVILNGVLSRSQSEARTCSGSACAIIEMYRCSPSYVILARVSTGGLI